MTTNTFAYNGFGARVSKTDSAGTTTYLRNGTSVVAPVAADAGVVYTPGISERRGSASRFYHGDIKNFVEQTDSSGQIVSSQQYDAFGNPVSSTGTWSGPFAYGGRFGYQSDSDTSLSLLGHRYYDSTTGRFLSRDPIGDGRNWYGYCGNNPVTFADSWGLKPILVIIIGDLTSGGDIRDESAWLLAEIYRVYEDEYEIRIRKVKSRDQMVEHLVYADAAILIGHGGPFVVPGDSVFDADEIQRVRKKRFRLGRGRLKFIRIYSCNMMIGDGKQAWISIANAVFGFDGVCYSARNKNDLDAGGRWWRRGRHSAARRLPVMTPEQGGVR